MMIHKRHFITNYYSNRIPISIYIEEYTETLIATVQNFDDLTLCDLVNRNILFYKLLGTGWLGKVIDTLRSLYQETSFCVSQNGRVSASICNAMGVNQGGVASGLLFRKYMADLGVFLNTEFGVCIGEMITAHTLLADDLILMSDSPEGLQHQINGLFRFCSQNLLLVNTVKTKCMVICHNKPLELYLNGQKIEQVMQYKYLGNITNQLITATQMYFLVHIPICVIKGERPYLVWCIKSETLPDYHRK